MNPRIAKLKEERKKNERKIQTLQKRNKDIETRIVLIENQDIIGMARETGMTLDELEAYLKASRDAVQQEKRGE